MKLPPFTLVQASRSKVSPRKFGELSLSQKEYHKRIRDLGSFNSGLQNALASSLNRGILSASDLSLVTEDLNHSGKSKAIGIWGLRAWVGGLPHIIEHLNRAQSALTFFEVQAAIPSGLVQSAERVAFRANKLLRRKLKPAELKEIRDAVVDIDFFPNAHKVRKTLGVDYLIALTGAAIAGEIEDKAGHTFHTDFFFSYDKHVCLVSTEGLREYARVAKRPFEMAAAYVAVGGLLAAMNHKVDIHDRSAGCLFDYNYDRSKIVVGLKKPLIEVCCLKDIKEENRETAQSLVHALATYKPPGTRPAKPHRAKKSSREKKPREQVL